MMARDMSGPAFPQPETVDRDGYVTHASPGMTLRDYFAIKSLASIGTWIPTDWGPYGDKPIQNLCNPAILAVRAEWAYAQADAMLKEREK